MSEIEKLGELTEEHKSQAIGVFVEGFYDIFRRVSRNKAELARLFSASIDFNSTYALLEDDAVVGIMLIGRYEKSPFKLDHQVFSEIHSGWPGRIIFRILRHYLEKVSASTPDQVYIDYLAASPQARGRGIGTKLIAFARDNLATRYLMLEVYKNNPKAQALYERLGFQPVRVRTNLMELLEGLGRSTIMRLEVGGPDN